LQVGVVVVAEVVAEVVVGEAAVAVQVIRHFLNPPGLPRHGDRKLARALTLHHL
jgi:hypothetical protein